MMAATDRCAVIVNPRSGRGRGLNVWRHLQPVLQERYPGLDVRLTAAPGEAVELARELSRAGYHRVLVVGGDGTFAEAASGLAGSGAVMGLIPAGTGNDLARTLGISRDPLTAVEQALNAPPCWCDAGRAGDRHFLNVAGIGFDAEVARATNEGPKWMGGTLPYLLGMFRTLSWYRPVPLELEADGRRIEVRSLLIAVANCRWYGGGMMIAPYAEPDDGWLDVIIAGDLGRIETLGVLPSLYRGGHLRHPKVHSLRVRRLTVQAERPVSYHADGEVLGRAPVEFELLPRAIKLAVPARAAKPASPS